jgi:hypothetical protein
MVQTTFGDEKAENVGQVAHQGQGPTAGPDGNSRYSASATSIPRSGGIPEYRSTYRPAALTRTPS